jgi:hypothetical protein
MDSFFDAIGHAVVGVAAFAISAADKLPSPGATWSGVKAGNIHSFPSPLFSSF